MPKIAGVEFKRCNKIDFYDINFTHTNHWELSSYVNTEQKFK
jgi:hypothetical protein